jgi:O-antigen/teichoic acid export membrane protein
MIKMQKNSLFKNAVYKSLLSFVSIVVPLIVGPYIARVLDVNLYGIYNTVYSDFQIFLIFASFGVYTYGVREISKIRDDKKKVAKLFTNLFVVSLISNIIVGIIFLVFALTTSTGITKSIYLLFLIQIVANIFYIEFVNEALENYKFITIKSIVVKLLYLAALLIFVKKPTDIIPYALIICITVFLNNFLSFLYVRKKIPFDFKNVEIVKYISPLLLVVIITNIDALYGTLDMVILGKLVNGFSVTIYYIPYYIVGTLGSIPYSIINVGIPRLSYNYENLGKLEYEKTLKKITSSLLFLIFPICFGVFVLSKEVIWLYAGEKYIAAAPILALSCIFKIFISCQSVLTNLVLYIHGKEKIIVKYGLFFGILNGISDIVLYYLGQLTSFNAMATTCVCMLLLFVFQYLYAKNNLKLSEFIFNKQNLLYLILSAMFIPISMIIRLFNFSMSLNILLIIVSCSLFYSIVLYIKKDEIFIYFINKFKIKLKKSNN